MCWEIPLVLYDARLNEIPPNPVAVLFGRETQRWIFPVVALSPRPTDYMRDWHTSFLIHLPIISSRTGVKLITSQKLKRDASLPHKMLLLFSILATFKVCFLFNSLSKNQKIFPKFLLCVCVYAHLRAHVTCVKVPSEARREHRIPWSWSYRRLWPSWHGSFGFSGRARSAFNSWAISRAP